MQHLEVKYNSNNSITSSRSLLLQARHAVPHGSVLGPPLFLYYMRGLPNLISDNQSNNMCIYTYDTCLKISNQSSCLENTTSDILMKISDFLG